jgi:hypothetical protein
MKYKTVVIRKFKNKFGEHIHVDYTGSRIEMGSLWESTGTLLDIVKCMGHYVGINPFNRKPVMVAHSPEELKKYITQITQVENIVCEIDNF